MSPTSIQEEEIFQTARRIKAADARRDYLDQACGDNAPLRRQVELLLAAFDSSDNFLESPAAEIAAEIPARDPTISEGPGTVIGPYRLLEQIGEGGMGVVFLAEQQQPVKRRVALKVIKPGMDTRQVIARFEAERQALALMDHPNIAKVLDAGTTGTSYEPDAHSRGGDGETGRGGELDRQAELRISPSPTLPLSPSVSSGRPYFVMELVQGVPITDYCDQCNLTTHERLKLFVTVCQAVQHAHQKGIIHRDLKPTNILVAIQDGRPVPKIIDFGVAKAINQQLTEHTLMTAFMQIVGTPLYMSPEQAELSPLGVDTRSDIYSLGVLLYELLTGTTPFEKERLHAVPYDELRRIIREEEPPRPSARISTLTADIATTVAERRHTDTRRLRQTVHGDLDWIVMKCLEKDRNRRYDSAGSLARDVERYLQDEPVQACPPSLPYRLKKFIRRNKVAAAFIGLLIASVAALTASNIQSSRNEQRAITESARAQAVSDLLQEMLASADAARAKGADYKVRELLDDFSAGLGNQLTDQPEAAADIHATIGRAYRSLKLPDKAQPHFEKAVKLRRDVEGPERERLAAILVDYGWNLVDQQRRGEAESQLNEALDIYRQRGIDGAPLFHALEVLQHVLISANRVADAERVTEEALAVAKKANQEFPDQANLLHRYAGLKITRGQIVEGEQIAREAVDMHRRLHGEQHPETAFGLKTLGRALQQQQKLAAAEEAFRDGLAIFRHQFPEDHPNIQDTLGQVRGVLETRRDKAALEALDKEDADRDVPGYHLRMAGLLVKDYPRSAASSDVARQLIRRAIEGYSRVAINSPDDLARRLKAADGYLEVIKLCVSDPDFAQEVDETHRKLASELEGLLADFPDSTNCREQVGHKYRVWAIAVQQNSNYLSQSEQAHNEAIRLLENVLNDNPDKPQVRFCLANSYAHRGDVQKRLRRFEDAEASFRHALDIYDEYAPNIAEHSTHNAPEMTSDYFRISGLWLGNNQTTGARQDQARKFIRRVIDMYSQVAVDYPGDLNRRVNALTGHAQSIWICDAALGFDDEVDELNRRLEAELPKLLDAFPDSSDCLWHTANLYRHWAVQSSWDSTNLPTAERAIRESIKLHEKLSLSESKRPGVWLFLADRNIVLGYMLWRSSGPDVAEAVYRRALQIFDEHAAEIAADTRDQIPGAIVIDAVWLADFFGCTGHEDKAAELIRTAVLNAGRVTDPTELALAHYFIALLQARLGDEAGYRATCQALVDVPIASADDYTKGRTILTWCHAPAALADLSLLVQRAEEFAAHNAVDQPHVVPYVLGAALYRNGQYERAAKELEKSIAAHPSDPPPWDRIINWQRLFLAMTQWQLGSRDQARQLLAKIQPAIDEELRSPTTPMNYRITLEILRREAEALIRPNEADEAVENEISTSDESKHPQLNPEP